MVNKDFVVDKVFVTHNTLLVSKNTNRLKVLRAGKGGMSQLDASLAVGIKHYRYWRIENGYEAPTPEERKALARLFGVEETEVFQAQQEVAS